MRLGGTSGICKTTPSFDLLGGVTQDLPWWLSSKEFACQCWTQGFDPWGRSLGEGNGNPLQYSCLGNPMDRGA